MTFTTYYVLKGLINGERGARALRTNGEALHDGHYYLVDGDPDGVGPYDSTEDARDAALQWIDDSLQTWAFPLEVTEPPYRLHDDDPGPMDGTNVAKIKREDKGLYSVKPEGWYERLDLTITAPSIAAVVDVYAQLIRASARYQ